MTTTAPTHTAERVPAGQLEVGDVIAQSRKAIESGDGDRITEVKISASGKTTTVTGESGTLLGNKKVSTDVWRVARGAEDEGEAASPNGSTATVLTVTDEPLTCPECGSNDVGCFAADETREDSGDLWECHDCRAQGVTASYAAELAEGVETAEQRIYRMAKEADERLSVGASEEQLAEVTDLALQQGYGDLVDADLDIVLGGMLAEAQRPEPREPSPDEGGLPEGGPSSDTRADEANAELQAEYDALMDKGRERGWSGSQAKRLQELRSQLGIKSSPPAPAKGKPAPKRTQRASTSDGSERPPREGSTLDGVLKVLRDAEEPMRPDDIFAAMKKRRLTGSLKGKTPEATVAAQLAVAAKAGKHGIHRPEKGRYAVAS